MHCLDTTPESDFNQIEIYLNDLLITEAPLIQFQYTNFFKIKFFSSPDRLIPNSILPLDLKLTQTLIQIELNNQNIATVDEKTFVGQLLPIGDFYFNRMLDDVDQHFQNMAGQKINNQGFELMFGNINLVTKKSLADELSEPHSMESCLLSETLEQNLMRKLPKFNILFSKTNSKLSILDFSRNFDSNLCHLDDNIEALNYQAENYYNINLHKVKMLEILFEIERPNYQVMIDSLDYNFLIDNLVIRAEIENLDLQQDSETEDEGLKSTEIRIFNSTSDLKNRIFPPHRNSSSNDFIIILDNLNRDTNYKIRISLSTETNPNITFQSYENTIHTLNLCGCEGLFSLDNSDGQVCARIDQSYNHQYAFDFNDAECHQSNYTLSSNLSACPSVSNAEGETISCQRSALATDSRLTKSHYHHAVAYLPYLHQNSDQKMAKYSRFYGNNTCADHEMLLNCHCLGEYCAGVENIGNVCYSYLHNNFDFLTNSTGSYFSRASQAFAHQAEMVTDCVEYLDYQNHKMESVTSLVISKFVGDLPTGYRILTCPQNYFPVSCTRTSKNLLSNMVSHNSLPVVKTTGGLLGCSIQKLRVDKLDKITATCHQYTNYETDCLGSTAYVTLNRQTVNMPCIENLNLPVNYLFIKNGPVKITINNFNFNKFDAKALKKNPNFLDPQYHNRNVEKNLFDKNYLLTTNFHISFYLYLSINLNLYLDQSVIFFQMPFYIFSDQILDEIESSDFSSDRMFLKFCVYQNYLMVSTPRLKDDEDSSLNGFQYLLMEGQKISIQNEFVPEINKLELVRKRVFLAQLVFRFLRF